MCRMPAFGLSGPWRDRTGFAMTIEQASGLAWMTGHAGGPPMVPRGVCDPVGGMHAAFAMMLALEHRERTGEAQLIEVALIEPALNIAAEQVIEWSANGVLLERHGQPLAVRRAARCVSGARARLVGGDVDRERRRVGPSPRRARRPRVGERRTLRHGRGSSRASRRDRRKPAAVVRRTAARSRRRVAHRGQRAGGSVEQRVLRRATHRTIRCASSINGCNTRLPAGRRT